MSPFLSGKKAIVTGASRGIGFAIARHLLDAGASVAICGRSPSGVEEALARLRSTGVPEVLGLSADVSLRDQVIGLFRFVDENFGGVDILVNNAGVGIFQAVAELKPEDWTRTLETNLSGAFHCSQEALSRFRRRGGGFIINIGSLAGRNAFAGGGAYNATKFGLLGFTEALMMDHRNENVRVSTVMPGSVATEFSRDAGSGAHGSEWKIAPEDVAEIVLAILRMPERTLVSRVEVRPSRPRN
jgi:NAD(P)-dependent dehydrogenase (short-subunit alcohol dehydrogenase family)